MKLDFMKASEAKAMAEDCKNTVTDEHYAQMVREINRRIGHDAEVGEFECKVRVDDLFGTAGLKELRGKDRKPIIITIIYALREVGYTIKALPNSSGTSYLHIVISW